MSAMQGTAEWLLERSGFCTASRAADVLARIKSGEAASRRNYRAALVAERLTGIPQETYQSAEMKWGIETEPLARESYEVMSGDIVDQVGFIRHAELMAGASLDGVIGADGAVEFKCPLTATHIETLLHGMPSGHIPQLQFQLWITGRKWVDFCSFDPRMPERLQLYVQRIARDSAYITQLAAEVTVFLAEVDQLIAKLNERK